MALLMALASRMGLAHFEGRLCACRVLNDAAVVNTGGTPGIEEEDEVVEVPLEEAHEEEEDEGDEEEDEEDDEDAPATLPLLAPSGLTTKMSCALVKLQRQTGQIRLCGAAGPVLRRLGMQS